MFSKTRTSNDIDRYVAIMEKALEAGVRHPRILTDARGNTVCRDKIEPSMSLVLMDFIEGKSFFDMDRAPDAMFSHDVGNVRTLLESVLCE